MRITDLTIVDKTYKAYRKIITLQETIAAQMEYHEKHSPKYTLAHRHAAIAALDELKAMQSALRLDSTELNSHILGQPLLRIRVKDTLSWIFIDLEQPRKAVVTPLEQALIDNMNTAGRQARCAAHEARLAWEIAYRASQGWFMLFNTLTVAPGEYYKVFHPDSDAFQTYIRQIDNLCARAAYGSTRNAKGKEYHTYCAVIEEGAKHGRLHIHVLHLFSHLPPEAEDPNKALRVPYRRELNVFKARWQHGFTSPIMVRYSPQDAYGKKGYRWPYDNRTQQSYLIKSPLHIAGYMSKYITKTYTSKKRTENLWRIRRTRNLGQQIPTELLSTLTLQQLLAAASCNSLNLKINNRKIPRAILQQEALRQYQRRSRQSSRSLAPTLAEMGEHIAPIPSPLHSLRGSTRKTTINNLQKHTDTLMQAIKDTDEFDNAWRALKASAYAINQKYFRKSYIQGTTSNGDHLYSTAPNPQ